MSVRQLLEYIADYLNDKFIKTDNISFKFSLWFFRLNIYVVHCIYFLFLYISYKIHLNKQ